MHLHLLITVHISNWITKTDEMYGQDLCYLGFS